MGGKRRKAADFGGSLRPRSRMVYQIRDTENGVGVAGGGGRASGENESPALPPCSHISELWLERNGSLDVEEKGQEEEK